MDKPNAKAGESVEIIEVSPRDGLQNEPSLLPTSKKLELIRRALDAGVKRIEVASFVHPRIVPQMADAEDVCAGLPTRDDVTYVGLVLNEKGLERALDTGRIDEIGCVAVASEGFGQANQHQSVEQSVTVCSNILRRAREAGKRAQVTISVAFGCPFDGETPVDRVVDIARRLAAERPTELALADTIGVAVPSQVKRLLSRVRDAIGADIPLRAHFHNTRNTGIANAYAALESGVQRLDSAIGGIGGCPFAPKATGNIATEDLFYLLDRSEIRVGLELDGLIHTAHWLENELGHAVPGLVSKAGGFPKLH
ncbi:MAG: hydroxymethylglutaryl-CoA lyase [Xanthomonadales bacterium]|nr:hydroxymethylglutaryl-CoA lyase [Xanthomonadales bacterium]